MSNKNIKDLRIHLTEKVYETSFFQKVLKHFKKFFQRLFFGEVLGLQQNCVGNTKNSHIPPVPTDA